MFDDLDALAKAAFGLLGAFVASFFGAMTRQIYADDGFKWRRALLDIPLAAFSAILAGGIGQYFGLPEMVILALAGSLGYMGPHFISGLIKRAVPADKEEGGDAP